MLIRYRITATFVSLILMVGYLSPHKTLNRYVEVFANFKPTDGEQWTVTEQNLPDKSIFEDLVTKLNFDKLREKGKLNGQAFEQTKETYRDNTCHNALQTDL
jgi:hypothetical protein